MPLTISVIIPTYNRAALVREALDSLLAQTRVPDEIIVIDDGSTDDTPDVLARYGDPVRVIRQNNRGRSAARNRGLDAAQGDLIAFLDSDDRLPPDSIARRVAAFEQQPAVNAVYGDTLVIGPHGDPQGLSSAIYPVPRPSGAIFGDLIRRNFITMPSVTFRRTPASAPLRFDAAVEPAEDYDFWLRLAAHARFLYLDEPLAEYRIAGSATHDVSDWGLTGESAFSDRQQMKRSEIAVQARAMHLPEFAQLPRVAQAKFFCAHGMKTLFLQQHGSARRLFVRAIRRAPWYPTGYALLLLSALPRVFESAIFMRRRIVRWVSQRRS
jgi:glycosyltransferase involved in cell wall biosynthesis